MIPWEQAVARYQIAQHVPIGPLTTYKLGGPARWFCELADEDSLRGVTEQAISSGVKILVLGRGSNVVISDRGFDGLVVRLTGVFRQIEVKPAQEKVVAGAAVPLPQLARHTAEQGWGGLEFYVGIPGSVGGAVAMNAGFFGTETRERLISARVLDTQSGAITTRENAAFGFGYRHSNITPAEVVLTGDFQVDRQDPPLSLSRMREAIKWRREHQPGGTLNAGSVFCNPPGDYAGRIIDQLGLKGMSRGAAHVSERHANFFVTSPGASAQDVYDLVQSVRRQVRAKTGIDLQPEIRFIGDFASAQGKLSA